MKNKYLTTTASIFTVLLLLVLNINIVSAEINMWTDTYVNKNTSTVNMYALVELYDTSDNLITISKPVPVTIKYGTQFLPYNISQYYPQYPDAYVDWCNLTTKQEINEFDTSTGRIVNYSTIENSLFFTNFSSGVLSFRMHHEDILSISMACHYTNPDTLFIESLYFGQYSIFFPAHECVGCDKYSFEELTQENEKITERINQETSIYSSIQKVIEKNYQLWLILKWVLRIALLIGAVGLIFAGIYFFYQYIKKMAGVR